MAKLTFADMQKRMFGRTFNITGVYGELKKPRTRKHDGVDLPTPSGTLVKFPFDAEVTFERFGVRKGSDVSFGEDYGNYTGFYMPEIDETWYLAHTLYKGSYVDKGKKYKKGQTMLKTGNTGLTTGPHVHIGRAKGRITSLSGMLGVEKSLDPAKFVFDDTPKEPVVVMTPEKAVFYPDRTINVRNYPKSDNKAYPVQAQYFRGESIKYDNITTMNGHVWISYLHGKQRRFVAIRTFTNGKYGPLWGNIK